METTELLLNYTGDSMSPKFEAGDKIYCIEQPDWKQTIAYGQPYLLITADGQNMIRYLQESTIHESLLLVPENSEHDAFDIPLSAISRVFSIKGSIRRTSL